MPQDNNSKRTLQEIHDSYDYEERPRRRWPTALAYLWAAFLVAVVVVFGGRWIYRSVNDSDNKQTTASNTSQQQTGTEKQAENKAVIVPAKPNGNASISVPNSSTSSGSGSSSNPTPAPTQVPNTGDGAPSPSSLPNTGG